MFNLSRSKSQRTFCSRCVQRWNMLMLFNLRCLSEWLGVSWYFRAILIFCFKSLNKVTLFAMLLCLNLLCYRILLDSYSPAYFWTSFGTYNILKYNLVLRTICVHVHALSSVKFELYAHNGHLNVNLLVEVNLVRVQLCLFCQWAYRQLLPIAVGF